MSKPRLLKVASVDPSLRNFGIAIATIDINDPDYAIDIKKLHLQSSDNDKTSKKVVRKNSDDIRRARLLHRALDKLSQDVNMVFVEVPVGSQSARSMASYGICIGILSAIKKPMIQVTPSEVKLAAVGSKTASKKDMIDWAVDAYPNAGWLTRKVKGKTEVLAKNEHLADAVAVIHASILTDQFEQAVAMISA